MVEYFLISSGHSKRTLQLFYTYLECVSQNHVVNSELVYLLVDGIYFSKDIC